MLRREAAGRLLKAPGRAKYTAFAAQTLAAPHPGRLILTRSRPG